jgi:hypothetical protein
VWWAVFAACGFVLGLAALKGPRAAPVDGGTGARLLLVRLPEPLAAAVLGLFALSALLLLAVLLPRELRRRRKDDEEPELYYERPKVSPWVLVVVWGLVLIPFAVIAYALWLGWTPFEDGVASSRLPGGSPGARWIPQGSERPIASFPLFSGALGFLALLSGLGSLGLMLWIVFGDRLARWWTGSPAGSPEPQPLIEVIDESLDDLRREPDTRRAIIMCYRRFEQVLARSGFPRAAWETPGEFMRQALSRLALPSGAVSALTELFELSKFSHHPVGPAERDVALAALVQIKSALERDGSHAATA